MTQDEIILMARQAGFGIGLDDPIIYAAHERFAKLVAQHTLSNIDPSKFMSYQEGFEAGRLAEREACAKVCEQTNDGTPYNLAEACADAIRARGQA
jgi:predicted acylesterase/phospholipase RssA